MANRQDVLYSELVNTFVYGDHQQEKETAMMDFVYGGISKKLMTTSKHYKDAIKKACDYTLLNINDIPDNHKGVTSVHGVYKVIVE